jgi:hypothetical protein
VTGDEIIQEARLNFGEKAALTLADTDLKQWVNTALRELYSLLSLADLEVLAKTAAVALTAEKGPLPATLDHLLSISSAGAPVPLVDPGIITATDMSPYHRPAFTLAATDGETLWVRTPVGVTATGVDVTYIEPPAAITDFALPVVLPKWHAVLVLFVTALAYAQEEDKGQAQHYRNEALALINRTFTAPEQEAL